MRPSHGETLRQARDLVREGQLGRVAFCRIVHDDLLPAIVYLLGPAAVDCVVGVETETDGATILGSRATLAISNGACHLYPSEA